MEKKLTKVQEKELARIQQDKENLRWRVLLSVNEYWQDCSAMERVSKIECKLFTEDKKLELLNRYEDLKFLTEYIDSNNVDEKGKVVMDTYYRAWSFIRTLNKSVKMYDKVNKREDYDFETKQVTYIELDTLPKNAIWIDDIIWDESQMKLYLQLCSKFGINKMYYTNASSGALQNITDLIKFNAKIIGTTNICEFRPDEGLIFDLSNVNI